MAHLDELDRRMLGGVPGREASPAMRLILRRGEEQLRNGVVAASAGAAARKDDRGQTVRQHGCPKRLLTVCDADGLDDDLRKQLAPIMEIFNGLGKAPPSESVQRARKIPRQRSLQDAAALT